MTDKLHTSVMIIAVTRNLGFTDDELLAIAESIDVTTGDADYTLVSCARFVRGVVSVCGDKRADQLNRLLDTNWPDYIAFTG
jgi:hypothetical protein